MIGRIEGGEVRHFAVKVKKMHFYIKSTELVQHHPERPILAFKQKRALRQNEFLLRFF